jgi:hypothetical protein
MNIYKVISFVLLLLFAITGILFLSLPDEVINVFNTLSLPLGMPISPLSGWNFYLILAVGYMYLVTVLAFLMFIQPENHSFPLLLVHAKFASSVLSLILFLVQAQYLIYLANFIIDCLIGIVVLIMYFKMRKKEWA